MLTNPRADRVRAVRALSRRVARERQGQFVAEGPQAVRELLASRPDLVLDVYLVPGSAGDQELGATARESLRDRAHEAALPASRHTGGSIHEVSAAVLAAMAGTEHPQGVLAVCRTPRPTLDEVLAAAPRLLVLLSHVRDPGNAGTVIRSADAAGADAVLVSDASVDVFNPKVVRATAGSLFHLPVVTGLPVDHALAALRRAGVRRLAADGRSEHELGHPEVDTWLDGPHIWVMGNEAWGLPGQVRDDCDAVVRVPIYGRAESLNLATAATVCLYASATRQRAALAR